MTRLITPGPCVDIDAQRLVNRVELLCLPLRALQFVLMPLPVIKRQAVYERRNAITHLPRYRKMKLAKEQECCDIGCASGNWMAAAGSGTLCAWHIVSIFRVFSMISEGAVSYAYNAPSTGPVARMPEANTEPMTMSAPCSAHFGNSSSRGSWSRGLKRFPFGVGQ